MAYENKSVMLRASLTMTNTRAQTDFWSYERPHGIMRNMENLCMAKALKMRAIKDTLCL